VKYREKGSNQVLGDPYLEIDTKVSGLELRFEEFPLLHWEL
jgi:hypothetical protein